MNRENELKQQLEAIFDTYKFTDEQRQEVAADLIKIGESLIFKELPSLMTEEQKSQFESLLGEVATEEGMKNLYSFVDQTIAFEKLVEIRNTVYNKLVSDYIAHMNA